MGPFHPHRHVPPPRVRRNEGKAVASLVLGLSSLTCLGFVTGLPAIILGAMARRDIDRSQGMLGGSGLAAGGIVSGLFGTGLGLVALLFVLGGAVEVAQHPAKDEAPIAAGTRSYGALDVVDLEEGRPLRTQLGEVVRDARAKGRTVVLQTQARTSPRCAEIAAALPDLRMQRALANVTLVRVDVDRFAPELRAMRVETKSAPWFYKLDASALPTDAISADDLDTTVPEKMAHVLGRFVRGTLSGH